MRLPKIELSLKHKRQIHDYNEDSTSCAYDTLLTHVKAEPLSPTGDSTPFDFSPQKHINIKRESKARPLSKRQPVKIYSRKKQSAQTGESANVKMSTLDMLQRCRSCELILVDCWKNKPLPKYIQSWLANPCIYTREEQQGLKKKKKKSKSEKVN